MTGPERAPAPRSKVLRFLLVGVFNTGLDLSLLMLLLNWGVHIWIANAVSTGIALTVSFFLNKKFTFSNTGNAARQGFMFLVVTLVGLWLLQPAAMSVVIHFGQSTIPEPWLLFLAKGVATVLSMTWNFLLYNKVVFRSERNKA